MATFFDGGRWGRRQLGPQVGGPGGELVEQVHLLDESADGLGDGLEVLAGGVLGGVDLPRPQPGGRGERGVDEDIQAREELARIGLVERVRLAQLGDGLGECPALRGVQVRLSRCPAGQGGEASAELSQRGLEGVEGIRNSAPSVQIRPR